jgi:hypothetical protein
MTLLLAHWCIEIINVLFRRIFCLKVLIKPKNTEGPLSPKFERYFVDERTKLPLRFFIKN